MDSADRNFLGLVGVAATLAAYALCGSVAYVMVPLLGLSPSALVRLGPLCLLPAIALVGLLGTSAAVAGRTVGRRLSASRRLARRVRVHALPPTTELAAAVEAVGLQGRVTLVDSPRRFSFVHGILVPRVAISTGFLGSLAAEELGAALAHERYHVRHLDPLRALIGDSLAGAFFLLPSLEVLRRRYEVGRELEADRAAERAGGRRPLLGALLKALEDPDHGPVAGVSLADPGLLEARIARLETGGRPRATPLWERSLATSAVGTSCFLALMVAAVVGLGGSTALTRMIATELSVGGTLLGALCVAPLVAVAWLGHRHLSRRAAAPLPAAPGI